MIWSLQLIAFAKESIKPDYIFKLKEVAQSNNFIDMGIVWGSHLTVDYMGNVFILETKYSKVIKLDKNLKLIDPKGNICLILKRDVKRKKLSHKEILHFTNEYIGFSKFGYTRDDIKKSLEKYEYKNVIREIKISNSSIYLFLTPDDTTIENKFPVEVYSFKGKLINKGFSPVVPEKISNNFFYVIKTDKNEDEDTRKLIKYNIIYNK